MTKFSNKITKNRNNIFKPASQESRVKFNILEIEA